LGLKVIVEAFIVVSGFGIGGSVPSTQNAYLDLAAKLGASG
jgi:hypothetical protein